MGESTGWDAIQTVLLLGIYIRMMFPPTPPRPPK
jgi:hypothetical protein